MSFYGVKSEKDEGNSAAKVRILEDGTVGQYFGEISIKIFYANNF